MKKTVTLLFILLWSSFALAKQSNIVVVLFPTPQAARPFLHLVKNVKKSVVSDVTYFKGSVNKAPVVSVISGYGEVNMINITSMIYSYFHPKLLVNAESVQSSEFQTGHVIVTSKKLSKKLNKQLPFGVSSDASTLVPMDVSYFHRVCRVLKAHCVSVYSINTVKHLAPAIHALVS